MIYIKMAVSVHLGTLMNAPCSESEVVISCREENRENLDKEIRYQTDLMAKKIKKEVENAL